MRNLTNRTKVALTMLCYLGLTLFMNSCNDADTPTNCGCESETLSTIPNGDRYGPSIEEQKSGLLFFKRPENIDMYDRYFKGYYDNRFWISGGKVGIAIICNENTLGTEYDYLKNSNDSIPICFTGNTKRLCKGPLIVLNVYLPYSEIKLTSIEQQ